MVIAITSKLATLGSRMSRLKHALILKFLFYFYGDNYLVFSGA